MLSDPLASVVKLHMALLTSSAQTSSATIESSKIGPNLVSQIAIK